MKELWIIISILSLILGIIGILLPILPTTPFLLLSSYGLTKGSTTIHKKVFSIPFIQKHLNSLEMTRLKKWTLLLSVDALLIIYMIMFNSVTLYIVLPIIILIKHLVFYKYVKIKKVDI